MKVSCYILNGTNQIAVKMKLKSFILMLFLISFVFTSCRKEESEFIDTPDDKTLISNSNIALLMQRTALNDGSKDNIVDKANCFDITFPYTVNANGMQLILNSEDDFTLVECIFDQSDSDTDQLNITYPITVVLADYSEVTIANATELNALANTCNGENVTDDDIECIDFEYPIPTSIFNPNTETLDVISLQSDSQLYDFIENIDPSDIITIDFPIMVDISDNSEVSINNLNELEISITNAINFCNEDDDYDFNDDDCNNCTPNTIETILTSCNDWTVNRLKRGDTDYDNIYDGYEFNFFTDGTVTVRLSIVTTYQGTWTANGSGNDLDIIINIPTLPLCNNTWRLQQIKNCSFVTEVNLTVGDADRLQYKNGCN